MIARPLVALIEEYAANDGVIDVKLQLLDVMKALNEICDTLDEIRRTYPDTGPQNKSKKPQASPDLLSLHEMRCVYTALDIVWVWGIMRGITPHLGTGSFVSDKLHPKSFMLTREYIYSGLPEEDTDLPLGPPCGEVFPVLKVLMRTVTHPTFCHYVLDRNLGRILGSLFVISACDNRSLTSESVQNDATKALEGLSTSTRVPTHVIISEALHGLGGFQLKARIHKVSSRFLTSVITRPEGVRSLFEALLRNVEDPEISFQLFGHIARLLCSVPAPKDAVNAKQERQAYLSTITMQVISILEGSAGVDEDVAFLRTAAVSLSRLCDVFPGDVGRYMARRWGEALRIGVPPPAPHGRGKESEGVLYSQDEVLRAVHMPLVLLTKAPPSPSLGRELKTSGLLEGLLQLALFVVASAPLSPLKNPLLQILSTLLEFIPRSEVPAFLLTVAMRSAEDHIVGRGYFETGPDMGVLVKLKQPKGVGSDDASSEALPSLLKNALAGLRSSTENAGIDDLGGIEAILAQASLAFEDEGGPGAGGLAGAMMRQGDAVKHLVALLEGIIPSPEAAKAIKARKLQQLKQQKEERQVEQERLQRQARRKKDQSASKTEENRDAAQQNHDLCALETLASDLFVFALRKHFEEEGGKGVQDEGAHVAHGLLVMSLTSSLAWDQLLSNGAAVVDTLGVVLERHARKLDSSDYTPPLLTPRSSSTVGNVSKEGEREGVEDVAMDGGPVGVAVSILSTLLGLGNPHRADDEEAALQRCLPSLETIGRLDRDTDVAQAASSTALLLITRKMEDQDAKNRDEGSADRQTKSKPKPKPKAKLAAEVQATSPAETLATVEDMLADASPAMRGLGVRHLIISLREADDQKLSGTPSHGTRGVVGVDAVRDRLVCLLNDEDSFVYLNVVHALGRLVDLDRKRHLTDLVTRFRDGSGSHVLRAKLGEALVYALRRAGEAAPAFVKTAMTAALAVVRSVRDELQQINQANVDISGTHSGRPSGNVGDDTAEKETASMSGFLLQSAVSLLGEAVVMGGWAASGEHLRGAMDVAKGALRHASSGPRRAGAFLLRHIIDGHNARLIEMGSEGHAHIISTVETLSIAADDCDEVVKFQARCALAAIDAVVETSLMPDDARDDPRAAIIPKIQIVHKGEGFLDAELGKADDEAVRRASAVPKIQEL